MRVAFSPTLAALAALASLSGCASPEATKTLGTLAGSSIGSAASTAVNASGVWGYVVSIASTAVGGIGGTQIAKLFGGSEEALKTAALLKALEDSSLGKAYLYGAEGKAPMGAVYATGPTFTSARGLICRSYMATSTAGGGNWVMGLLGGKMPLDVNKFANAGAFAAKAKDQASSSVDQAKDAASAVSSNPLEAAAEANRAAGSAQKAAGSATDTVESLRASMAPPTTSDGQAVAVDSENFGTACKDAKGGWSIVTPAA
jgi:hypothetical protein